MILELANHPIIASLVAAVVSAVVFAVLSATVDRPRDDKLIRQHAIGVAIVVFAVTCGLRYLIDPPEQLMQDPFRDMAS